jgi:membrane protease YdiL (CAAX protease family)
VLFSAAHIGYYRFDTSPQFILGLMELAAIGILLGLYRYRFNSLVAPFVAHGLLDFLPVFWRFG